MPSTIQLNQADPILSDVSFSSPSIAAQAISEDPRSCAPAIQQACSEQGSLCVDIDTELQATLDTALFQMDRFFSLLDNDGRKQDVRQDERGFGWVPRYTEPAYQPGTVSRLEAFDFGREHLSAGDEQRWPNLPGFRDNLIACWQAYAALGDSILAAMSNAFLADTDFLPASCNSREHNTMRLLHYAAQDEAPKANEVGISAHTDFEVITLLYQTAPGLELMDPRGNWIDAPASPGRLVVLIGDMIERWTNGSVHASGHRVRTSSAERNSIVMFVAANDDLTIGPLPQFTSNTQPPRYEPVTQLRHIENELNRSIANAAAIDDET